MKPSSRLYPLYLDSWGQDWEAGPWDSLADVLQQTLSADERTKLGLEHPVRHEDVFALLAAFREKVGSTPLVIFDQFDDYQAMHRTKFRSGGHWLKPVTVARNNPFWEKVAELLGARGASAPQAHISR
jgi:hypothetical protein